MNLKSLTASEFVKLKVPPRRYISDPFLPERGLVELYARTGVGKTTFTRSVINHFQQKLGIKQTEVLSPTFNLLYEYILFLIF